MGRLERNIRRKKRRRTIIFSLLAILLLFISGINITNNVMIQMTGLSQEEDIFSAYNVGIYMSNIQEFASEIQWISDLRIIVKNGIDKIQRLIEEFLNISIRDTDKY